MEFIRSIIPYIAQEKFAKQLETAKQLSKLFDLIRFEHVKDNEEARVELFGENGSREAYKQIRLRLRRKLIDFVLKEGATFKNVDAYSQQYRAHINALGITKYLMMNNAWKTAAEMSQILIQKTKKGEYTDITLSLSRDLYHYFSVINYDPAKVKKYKSLLKEMRNLYNAELVASEYAAELRSSFVESRATLKSKLLLKAEDYTERVTKYLDLPSRSYQLLVSVYTIISIRYELAKDYTRFLEVCDTAINEFQSRRVRRKSILFFFGICKMTCFIQLGRYAEVDKIASIYLQNITYGTINWFILNAYFMISKLYSQEYQRAYEIQKEVSSCNTYQKQPDPMRQTWTVYEAHIEFLIAIGKVQTDQPSKFRLNKFLNEIPFYTKDKQGLNIAILIIHVLFLLQQRKYSLIIDRVDALKQYCYRYLRKDDTFRSNCFIRMLLQMPRADFNRIRTERYAEPFLTKLRSVPIVVSDQSIEVEVIPYEDLWEMTLELLD